VETAGAGPEKEVMALAFVQKRTTTEMLESNSGARSVADAGNLRRERNEPS